MMSSDEFRAVLGRLGLSQARAAELLGVQLRTVQHWCAAGEKVSPPAERFIRLYAALRAAGFSDKQIDRYIWG